MLVSPRPKWHACGGTVGGRPDAGSVGSTAAYLFTGEIPESFFGPPSGVGWEELMTDARAGRAQRNSRIKSPLDFAGGLFLLGLAVVGYAGAFTLPFGQLSGIGSGLLPKVVAVLVAAFGIMLVVQALLTDGDRLEQWAVRGLIFVLGGVLVFALTIRSWGLLVAGPLSVAVTALADRESKPMEVGVLAVALTLVCGLLFKELLNLPIPFDPVGIIPDPVFRGYVGVKATIAEAFAALKAMFTR